jgi:signal recognition particle subunit SRP14
MINVTKWLSLLKLSDNSIVTFGEASESHPEPETSDILREPHQSKSLPIIIRATSGTSKGNKEGKIKLSTIVEVNALEAFFVRYSEVCKSGMSGLKKRDRSKGKKKMKAKKKKGGAAGGLEEAKKA